MNNTPLTLERYELEGSFFVASYLQNLRIKNLLCLQGRQQPPLVSHG